MESMYSDTAAPGPSVDAGPVMSAMPSGPGPRIPKPPQQSTAELEAAIAGINALLLYRIDTSHIIVND